MDQSGYIELLLAGDEEEYVSILARRMAKRNIAATTALSGSQAIRILRKGTFDAAVLDTKLDDMDGVEVLRIFKKMDPNMPVIMLTGYDSATDAKQVIGFGAFDYLIKPCDFLELVDKIRKACGRSI